ncbi:MAG: hypothetical protein HQ481_05815 [Alphaproteobacteria bacterium]|nr:hypothetical protein [Alphaproteobacteria bacterium]
MWGRNDLALGRDASSRFLPGLLAVMVFLAALAATGALSARGFIASWDARLDGSATVQIPPPSTGTGTRVERREAVMRLLRVTPGVQQARPVPEKTVARLLEPWLGAELAGALPMPTLIDLRLSADQPVDLTRLAERLENAAPGTMIDDHARWLSDARTLARTVTVTAGVVLVLVVLAAVLAVVFAVRTGLAVHREEIEILHLIGAPDRYIARQFQRHAGRLALVGGIIGVVLASGTLMGLRWWLTGTGPGSGPGADEVFSPAGLTALVQAAGFGWLEWAVILLLPFTAALIATVAARTSVLAVLARMP